jgi:hypothetical protein
MLWPLCLFPLAGLRWEQDMDSPRKSMVTDYFTGYWTVFGVHFMALLTIPSIGLLYFLSITKQ